MLLIINNFRIIIEEKPAVKDFSKMSFADFEALDANVIDLTTSTTTSYAAEESLQYDVNSFVAEEHDDVQMLKTGGPIIVVEQHDKEEAILNFMYQDKSDRLERILLSAGVVEEQYVQFPVDDRFINPKRPDDDLNDPSKCKWLVFDFY